MLKRLKMIAKNLVIKYFNDKYSKDFEKLYDNEYYEERLDYIRNSSQHNPRFFVLCRSHRGIGIYTHVLVYLSFFAYCLNKGYIPIVDMQTFPNMYLKNSDLEKKNAWEQFYNQPMGMGMDFIRNKKYKRSSPIFLPGRTPFLTSILENGEELKLYQKLYNDFIKYSPEARTYIDNELNLLKNKRCLGILCRGTDYTKGKPCGHPIQPSAEDTIIKARELIEKYECDAIYLATEEFEIEKKFREAFPEMVITNKRSYYDLESVDYSEHMLYEVKLNRENDEYLRGIEYISSIELLSRCSVFFGGGCAGSYAAVIMNNNKYEYWDIYNYGFYE